MTYSTLFGRTVSKLGFGCMRFPTLNNGQINEQLTQEMIDLAINSGVNYFDTAYPYHNGTSEIVIGKCLKKYNREDYFLVNKFPGHQIQETFDVKGIFEHQLKKCQVDYFDIYLLHNVCESSLDNYLDKDLGIIDFLLKQKELGYIKHLGFSTHARLDTLEKFLKLYGKYMEVCQIQLNYVDYTLQDAKGKLDLLEKYNIPVVVMEPLRGGKLARLSKEDILPLKEINPLFSATDWAFNYVANEKGVAVTLSGMSDLEQVVANIKTFNNLRPLTTTERNALLSFAEKLKDGVPCTACGYCLKGCPQSLNIPLLFNLYNDALFQPSIITGMLLDKLGPLAQPSMCIRCGACARICPQKIDIPGELKKFNALIPSLPNWAKICKEREEAAKKLNEELK